MRRTEGICSGCGTRTDAWYTPDGQAAVPPPYEFHGEVQCLGCQERDRFEKWHEKNKGDGEVIVARPSDPDTYPPEKFTERLVPLGEE